MKKTFLFPLTALALTLSTVMPARAEEAGLPQLDPSLFPEQLFWLAITFSTLYLLMHFVALPGVQKVQDKRKDVIDEALSAARTANEQAKAMGVEADRALADARAKANATINDIKLQTSKVAAEQQAVQTKELSQKLRDAEAGIVAKRDAALKEIENSVSDLAAAIVDNVSGLRTRA